MTMPYIAYAGVTSSDTDFVPLISPKQSLLADSRIIRWFVARPEDVELSGTDATKITEFNDRKAVGDAICLASDATRPTLSTSVAAYGNRPAATGYSTGTPKNASITGLDLTGPYFIATLARRSANVDEILFNQSVGASQITIRNSAGSGLFFQHFRGNVGINVPAGNVAPDTTPKLFFASWDGSNIRGAMGRGAEATPVAPGGVVPAANTVANIGKTATGSATSWGGDWAQIIIGNVNIFDPANAALKESICTYIDSYYGLHV